MIVSKVINNNVISAHDNGVEVVVMGRGIGYGVSEGQAVDHEKIRKVFRLGNKATSDKFAQLINDMPEEHVQIASDVIDYIKDNFDKKLSKTIYLTLTDHISFAIERFQSGIKLTNPLAYDVKTFYPAEYKTGQRALDIIKQRTGIELTDDEAASIALHIVNAEYGTEIEQILNLTEVLGTVIKQIEQSLGVTIYEDTVDFDRFVTHLKFFLLRLQKREEIEMDHDLNDMLKQNYKREYNCAVQIVANVKSIYGGNSADGEIAYLTVHLRRLVKHSKED